LSHKTLELQKLRVMTDKKVSKSFLKSERLLKNPEFVRVQKIERRFHTRNFILVIAMESKGPRTTTLRPKNPRATKTGITALEPPKQPPARLGITVTNKLEKNAVRRNRVKRMVRDAFRHLKESCASGISMIVIAKQGSAELDSLEVRRQLSEALEHNGFLIVGI
jgi:ribonuclease P protein component